MATEAILVGRRITKITVDILFADRALNSVLLDKFFFLILRSYFIAVSFTCAIFVKKKMDHDRRYKMW